MESYDDNSRLPWPDWRVTRKLGKGAFGNVYEIVRDVAGMQEKAALKIISRPTDGELEMDFDNGYDNKTVVKKYTDLLEKCVGEYKVMMEMKGQTNIVSCEDIAVERHRDGIGWDVFIRMELLTPLTQYIRNKSLSQEEVIKVGKDICKALMLCEEKNIVHRDIKPGNIMISRFGDYKLGDFGQAKIMDHTTKATTTGTPDFWAPEVKNYEKYGKEADIYSLGMVLYILLNNKKMPFIDADEVPLLEDVVKASARRYHGEKIPAPKYGSPALKAVVLKACEFQAEKRYRNAREMYQALQMAGQDPNGTGSHASAGRSRTVGADYRTAGQRNTEGNPYSYGSGSGTIGSTSSGTVGGSGSWGGSKNKSYGTVGNSWNDTGGTVGETVGVKPVGSGGKAGSKYEAPTQKTVGKAQAYQAQQKKPATEKVVAQAQGTGAAQASPQTSAAQKKKSGLGSWLAGVVVIAVIGYFISSSGILNSSTGGNSGTSSSETSSTTLSTADGGSRIETSYYDDGTTIRQQKYMDSSGTCTRDVSYHSNGTKEWDIEYWSDGKTYKKTIYYYDDEAWNLETNYDESGREMSSYKYENGTVTRSEEYNYGENGYTVTSKDANLAYWNIQTYDSEGKCTKMESYDGDGPLQYVTTMEYDADGNEILDRTCNANGAVTSEVYYDTDRKPTKALSYDENGNATEAEITFSDDGGYTINWP